MEEATNHATVTDETTVLPETDLIIEINVISAITDEKGINQDDHPDLLHLVRRVVVLAAAVSRAIGELEGI